jgi:hypothetical protein
MPKRRRPEFIPAEQFTRSKSHTALRELRARWNRRKLECAAGQMLLTSARP